MGHLIGSARRGTVANTIACRKVCDSAKVAVVVSEEFPADNTNGNMAAVAVYPRNYVIPRLRGVTVEQDYEVMNQRRVIVATQSLGFEEIVAGASADQPSVRINFQA